MIKYWEKNNFSRKFYDKYLIKNNLCPKTFFEYSVSNMCLVVSQESLPTSPPPRNFHPICPPPQKTFQTTRFPPSPSFSQSSLKVQIKLHWHKIVEHARNMLKSLYQLERKNMQTCIWLWKPLNKTRIKCSKKLSKK